MSIKMLSNRIYIKSVFPVVRNFQSAYNIKNIYPNSKDTLDFKVIENEKLKESSTNFTGFIPSKELKISYCKSSGPGGQNVNKLNTKVEMRFHVDSASWIPDQLKDTLSTMEAGRITRDGYLVVCSDKTRKQLLNQADCLSKIRCMLWTCEKQVSHEPSQEVLDVLKERKEKAKIGVLREKRHHSLKKEARCKPAMHDT